MMFLYLNLHKSWFWWAKQHIAAWKIEKPHNQKYPQSKHYPEKYFPKYVYIVVNINFDYYTINMQKECLYPSICHSWNFMKNQIFHIAAFSNIKTNQPLIRPFIAISTQMYQQSATNTKTSWQITLISHKV